MLLFWAWRHCCEDVGMHLFIQILLLCLEERKVSHTYLSNDHIHIIMPEEYLDCDYFSKCFFLEKILK
jgi:hypothetical protein